MTSSLQFIVLSATKVGDSSLVIHTLSEELGRRGFIVSVGKSAPMAMFQPMNILSGEYTVNPKSELWRMRNLSAESPLAGIRGNIHKNTMTMFLSEVMVRSLRDGANEEGLYEWCKKSILTLDALESDYSNFHLMFLLELCTQMGFRPTMDDLRPFCGERLEDIEALMCSDYAGALMVPLSGNSRNEIAGILLEYLGYHIESRMDIRSLRVLRELYA